MMRTTAPAVDPAMVEPAAGCQPQTFAMPVMLDGRVLGNLDVTICGDDGSAQRTTPVKHVLALLAPEMQPHSFAALQSVLGARHHWRVGQTYSGVSFSYDDAQVALVLHLPPAQRLASRVALRNLAGDVLPEDVIQPDSVSAYTNLYAARGYSRGLGMMQGWMPLRFDSDAALNVDGTVLEGSLNYVEDAAHPIMADNVRVVRDAPDAMIRTQLGELSYPVAGFQQYQQLLGVGIARNFTLQPYRVTAPAGRTTFVLQTPSTVDVFINNQRVRTLQLARGTYELRDFPIVNGVNNVRLRITDAYGRVEERVFPVVSDADLLEPGLSEFSLNAGVPVSRINRAKTYDTSMPIVTGLFRYGVGDGFTSGINLQASQQNQLLGLEQIYGATWGAIKAEAVASHAACESGLCNQLTGAAWRLEYRSMLSQDPSSLGLDQGLWSASVEHQGAGFTRTLVDNAFGSVSSTTGSYDAQLAYSRNLTTSLNGTVGAGYRFTGGSNADDSRNVFASAYWRAAPGWSLNLNTAYSTKDELSVLVGLSWFPLGKTYQVNSSYDADTHTARVDATASSNTVNSGWEASAGSAVSDENGEATGALTYNGERGFLRANHDVVSTWNTATNADGMGTQSQLQAGTSLVYAGGRAAMARPVHNSFIILAPRTSLAGSKIGMNPMVTPEQTTIYEAESGLFGPAVLSNAAPYLYNRVQATPLTHEDTETSLGPSIFVVKPGYKSGTCLRVGSDALAYATGTLLGADGKPIGLEGGELMPLDAENNSLVKPAANTHHAPLHQTMIFTNREGVFITEALPPGRYRIRLGSYGRKQVVFDMPASARGRLNTGELTLSDAPSTTGGKL